MQPDSSQQAAQGGSRMTGSDGEIVEIVVVAPEGRRTLHVAYFFCGASRKSYVGEELRIMAVAKNVGLVVHMVDILNGGGARTISSTTTRSPDGRPASETVSSTSPF